MKADEIVDDAMIRTAHEAYDAPGIWGRDEAMRAALEAVVPLFAEQFAKIAEDCPVPHLDADLNAYTEVFIDGCDACAAAIRASVKDRSPETQKPAVTPKGITAAE